MRRTLSYIVLGLMLFMGLYSAWQINLVTGVLKEYNAQSAEAEWDAPVYYDDGPVEPEPSDYTEPTRE